MLATALAIGQLLMLPGHIKDMPNASELRPPGRLDDGVVFCSMHFNRDRNEPASSGWNTDYPNAGLNLMTRLPEITTIRTQVKGEDPVQWVASVDSDDLFLCPFLLASDMGTMRLGAVQAERLSAYLQKGGFLWIDDTWGPDSQAQVLRELGKVTPRTWRLETPTFEHEVYSMLYRIRETLQVPHASFWTANRSTAERGDNSPKTPMRILVDEHGNPAAVWTHNSDIADTWERESINIFFEAFAVDGYAYGSNVMLYALTH